MARETITLVGRAHGLAFDDGTATWQVAIRRGMQTIDFNLRAYTGSVLEQFEVMDEGQLIGVIAELPPVRQRVAGAPLTVTRLEILGKAIAAVGA